MKLKNFLLIMLFAIGSTVSFAQDAPSGSEKGPSRTCNDPSNKIRPTSNDNQFTTDHAQAYYWTVTGNATISGSRTGRTVNISCTGDFTLRLVRFVNGNCYDYCEAFACDTGGGDCPENSDVTIQLGQNGGGLCSDFLVSIPSYFNVDHIDWDWAISGYTGTVVGANGATTSPLHNVPAGNWTGYYINVGATVTLTDGTVCPRVWNRRLLDCGSGPGGPIGASKAALYPNPSNGHFYVTNIKDQELVSIDVSDQTGKVIKSIRSSFDQRIDVSEQKEGMYFVTIIFKDGSKDVQKLVLRK